MKPATGPRVMTPSPTAALSSAALARLLVEAGHIAAADLRGAEQYARRENVALVDAVVATALLPEATAYTLLAQAAGTEFVALDRATPSELAVRLVPEKLARRHLIVPLRVDNRTLTYATCRPLDPEVDSDVGFAAGRRTVAVVAARSAMLDALEHCYPKLRDLDKLAERLRSEQGAAEVKKTPEPSESTVIDLCNRIISRAVEEGASDVHIEFTKSGATVRYRICGVLEPVLTLPSDAWQPVRNRFKVLGRADISVKNRPQDGAFRMTVNNRSIDIRFSSLPTLDGEKLVMRVADSDSPLRGIDNLGYDEATTTRLKRSLARPDGLVLVTGPTGSGKTTALYAALHHLQTGHANIVSVEDPVERTIPGISQIQVNVKAGNTLANVLRALLRQDPNVIMVGEVRDSEVAQIIGQAAYTGRLVLTSMHTADASTAVTRLVNLGLEPRKIAESLAAVLAQCLLRRLCRHCRRPNGANGQPGTYSAGKGCEQCRQTGYEGQLPIAELLVPSEEIRSTIARGATANEIRIAMRAAGCPSMRDQALALVARGDTSIEEVDRVLTDNTDASTLPMSSPATPLAPAATPSAPVAQPRSPVTSPLRVLVADDEPITRMLVKLLLERENYEVVEAANGVDAVNIGLRERPDLTLMDLNMPGLDGYEAIQRLRSAGGAAATMPIVVLTAEEGPTVEQRVLQLGADDYIQKPFDAAMLVSRVNAAFSRIRMHAA